ncbi:MAG: GNAT family N-acetyltransferase [Gammaproteobacteria bacterium]|nr:GNAT family N-acetyltransferase [Gammaproteobacteria bacterium]
MQMPNSDRLCYKLLNCRSKTDLDFLYALDNDPDVMRFINGGVPHSKQYITDTYAKRLDLFTNEKKGWGLWQIIDSEKQNAMGWVLVRPMNLMNNIDTEFDNLEIGWRLMKHAWGNGYASEAAQHMIEQLTLKSNDITKISAIADERNHSSIAVMKRLGMHYVNTVKSVEQHGDINVALYEKVLSPN